MNDPPYRERSVKELRRACRWALKKLHVDNWNVTLFFDDKASDHPILQALDGNMAGVVVRPQTLEAIMGVWRETCHSSDVDPLCVTFHECIHIVQWWQFTEAGEKIEDFLWQQSCNRFAWLLYEIWEWEYDE